MLTTPLSAGVPGPVMLDIEGLALTAADQRRLEHPHTGGVILFARNFETRQQLSALTQSIRALRPELLIAVDHEGGRVQRFRTDGFTPLPPMRRLGQLWDKDFSDSRLMAAKVATAIGYILASELRACGVDFSFAPVLDVDWGYSDVIGDRAFHSDPRVVTLLAKSLVQGMALAGMANCGKHFPGHGYVAEDSHHQLPTDKRPLAELLQHDAAPYQWFGLGLAAVMPAHVIYSQVDAVPAGFSPIWLQQILRRQLGFMGAVLSDDLAMEAAKLPGGVTEAAESALVAGCDMVLVCNRPDYADTLLDKLDWKMPAASRARIVQLKPTTVPLNWDDLRASDQFAAAFKLLKGL